MFRFDPKSFWSTLCKLLQHSVHCLWPPNGARFPIFPRELYKISIIPQTIPYKLWWPSLLIRCVYFSNGALEENCGHRLNYSSMLCETEVISFLVTGLLHPRCVRGLRRSDSFSSKNFATRRAIILAIRV